MMTAEVIKTTSKMMLVVVRKNKYDIAGTMGYCKNPSNLVKGDIIHDFPAISGITTMSTKDKETGEVRVMATKNGEPLSFLVFA